MRIGIQIPSFTWPTAIGPTFARIARDADQAGVHSLWLTDHFFQIDHVGDSEEPMLEAYTALGFAAAVTSRITLGTLATGATHRHPSILAKTVTTLAVLSGGRAWLGIGAGWNADEAAALGIPFPPLAERFERLEESVQIALRMFDGDEKPFHGKHFTVPRPLNSPLERPRLLIAGGGEARTLRLVARHADACNLFNSGDLPRKLEVLRGHCEREGRPFSSIEKTVVSGLLKGATPTKVVDQCTRLAALGVDHVIFAQVDADRPELMRTLAEAVPEVEQIIPSGR